MRRVAYGLQARDDLQNIYEYVSLDTGSRAVGRALVSRIRERCRHLSRLGGLLGTSRPELASGLRSTPSGPYLIFFRYGPGVLEVVRVVRGEREVERLAFPGEPDSSPH
jgi:toxin ParE1/3/4